MGNNMNDELPGVIEVNEEHGDNIDMPNRDHIRTFIDENENEQFSLN